MTFDQLIALLLFAFASSTTPGPNNLMLLTSGVNFGFRRSIPHMLGIGVGFVFLILMVGAGMVRFFDLVPFSHTILTIAAVLYLLWLAWKVANAAPASGTGASAGRPMTFLQAAAFQWLNPKAWTMALTAITVYLPTTSFEAVLFVALVFGAVNLPSVSVWTLMGQKISRFLTNPARLRTFNVTMAVFLIASLYPLLAP